MFILIEGPFVRSGSVQSDSSGFADTDTMETLRSGDLEQVLKVSWVTSDGHLAFMGSVFSFAP